MTELLDKYCNGQIGFNECFLGLKSDLVESVACVRYDESSDDWLECLDDARNIVMDLYVLIGSYKLGYSVEDFKSLSDIVRLMDL